jgi:hypothetical protein
LLDRNPFHRSGSDALALSTALPVGPEGEGHLTPRKCAKMYAGAGLRPRGYRLSRRGGLPNPPPLSTCIDVTRPKNASPGAGLRLAAVCLSRRDAVSHPAPGWVREEDTRYL